MKLHRVQLRNYRGVIESDVSFSPDGVTIVEGPNEVGKTAISEGLQLAIDMLDSSQHRRVKAVQPVDRDEGPEVEICLTSGKYDLVYRKRWLRQKMTTLEVTTPRQESWTGQAAHDRLKAIFAETLDEELWKALRIEQGTELKLPEFGPQSVRAALDRAAGGDYASDREETLWSRIGDEFHKYWTPTGQVPNERRSQEQRVNEARLEVGELEKQLQGIEDDSTRMSKLIDESTRLVETLKESENRERELAERWNAIAQLLNRVETLVAIHSASEAQRDTAAWEWERRQTLARSLDEATRDLTALEAEVENAAPGLEAAARRSEEAKTALRESEVAQRDAQSALTRATADREYLRNLIEVEQLKERHDRYLAAEESLRLAEEYLEKAKVDDEVAQRIAEAYIENERASSAADSGAASVEITALRDLTLEVRDDTVNLSMDEIHSIPVEDEAVLTIPQVAQVRVSAGPGSKGLADQRRRTQEEYRRLCDEVGVADADEAGRASRERQDTLRNKDEAVKVISENLRDLTPDVLLGKVESLTERVASYPQQRPQDPPLPPDHDAAQEIESEAREMAGRCEAERRACEDASRNVEGELTEVRLNEADRMARIRMARKTKEDLAGQLAIEREIQSDETLIAAVATAQDKESADRESLDGARTKLNDADPESAEVLLSNAKQVTERAREELQLNKDRQNELRVSLELRGEQGLQTSYDEACNKFNRLVIEHERLEARAEAVRLLRDTFAKHRHQAHQRYVGPLKERIDRFGRIVFGPTFEVEIDEELRVARRSLNGTTLNIDQLSTGAREQLGVIARLACATIVSPEDGGAPVIIDDALGWSDPQRLQSMGAAIAAAGRDCQVVVLTCTPGRYSNVGNAKVVTLDGRTAPSSSSEG